MTPRPELARLAAELDDVEIVHNQRKWPIPGTRAEKRAERAVALWFVISALVRRWRSSAAFLFWPYEYVAPGRPGYRPVRRSTPRSSASPSGCPCSRWASA